MVVVWAANAVKLIDTCDRLAIVAIMIAAVVLLTVAYLIGPVAAGPHELTVVCAVREPHLSGQKLGFIGAG